MYMSIVAYKGDLSVSKFVYRRKENHFWTGKTIVKGSCDNDAKLFEEF